MSEIYRKRDSEEIVEEQTLVKDTNGARIIGKGNESMRLSSDWKKNYKSDDELNAKDGVLDQIDLELDPPKDRMRILYLIMVLHGIGVLMPWNMFLNASSYFTDFKLNPNPIRTEYFFYLTLAAQIPNLCFNWFNVFASMGGNISVRIAWALVVEALLLVFTIALAMINTSNMIKEFFWITIGSVVILNTANAIYQNSVYGMAAKLPGKYTGAIILGSNLCGTVTSILDLVSSSIFDELRTAAIYFFITAIFFLLACFDTYFCLPLNRFYRYYEHLNAKQQIKSDVSTKTVKTPYLSIIKQCWLQLLCVFLVFFVTLVIFPGIESNIIRPEDSLFTDDRYYTKIMCFLGFNVAALLGSLLATVVPWKSDKWLIVPISLRLLFIPAFICLCNYMPSRHERRFEFYIFHEMGYASHDLVYFILQITMGLSSGYFSSFAMMSCSKAVEPRYASTAGMLAGAALSTGICAGIFAGKLVQLILFSKLSN